MGGLTRTLSMVALLAVIVAVVLVMLPGQDKKYLTASFPRTVSLYEGSDVRILGVPIGEVETVTPTGTDVTVRMSYDAKYKVPADAEAVIISPAIVGDRFVQLTPVYTEGAVLQSNAELSQDQTSTPLELDEIYQSIDDLTVALGPQGANSKGALTALLDTTARNFAGQGEQFNQTIKDLGKLTGTLDNNKEELFGTAEQIGRFVSALAVTGTLDNNKEELFGTAEQIGRFVSALAENDQTVRQFNESLAAAASMLEGERDDLAAALKNLGVAMQEVSTFVRENRDGLSENIEGLNVITKILVKQRDALSETLNVAPLALNNLFHTYNPAAGTLDTRSNAGENAAAFEDDPAAFLCSVLRAADPSKDCDLIQDALTGLPRTSALGSAEAQAKTVDVEYIDRSLAGLVAVK